MTALVSIVWYAWGSGRRGESRHTMAAQAKRTDRETVVPAQVDLDELRQRRLRNWRQTRETLLRDVEDAAGAPGRPQLHAVYPASRHVPHVYPPVRRGPHAQHRPRRVNALAE